MARHAALQHAPNVQRGDHCHPVSRWYLLPLANRLAGRLAPTSVRPWHVTALGGCAGVTAAVVLWQWPGLTLVAGVLVLLAWLCDRVDGRLARCQGRQGPWGAWFDGNVDELLDVLIHVGIASAAARMTGSSLPWGFLIAFLTGKYLLLHSLHGVEQPDCLRRDTNHGHVGPSAESRLRGLYHLPGNADVRAHLAIVALLTGMLTTELVLIALYYNLRWLARYPLTAIRMGGRLR